MTNIGELSQIVQKNCHISDARHAGNYSLCSFLLKMREYYRWEHKIPLSQKLAKEEVGNWLSQREQSWEDYEALDYYSLPVGQGKLDPFDTSAANESLLEQGYVYSGGYGLFHKPHFFLGKLEQALELDGIRVLVSSREYARDLVAPPAMTLDDTVFVRRESLRRFLWEKIEEWGWHQAQDSAMAQALACYQQFRDTPETLLDEMEAVETQSLIYHELGEIKAGELLGAQWKQMLSQVAGVKEDLSLRALKDVLADCISTLPFLLSQPNPAALHFYFAHFSGMRRQIFPQALTAYRQWLQHGSDEKLETELISHLERFEHIARDILHCYHNDYPQLTNTICRLLPVE